MKLRLVRKEFSDKSTIGDLFVDDAFECFTLEDVVRPVKIPDETAIPAGTYEVIITVSPHFKNQRLPLLVNVPNFEGVRIHSGNTSKDTEGCILVGQTKDEPDFIGSSRAAFAVLFPKIDAALQGGGKVSIEITEQRAG